MSSLIENAKEFGMFIAYVIVGILFIKQYTSKLLKEKDVSSLLPKQNKLDMAIIDKLEYMKELLGADRIQVYEFHNGDKGAENRAIYKFSCFYEVIKAGSTPLIQNCKQLCTAWMPHFIDTICEKGVAQCANIEEIKDSMPATYIFKKNLGILSFYDVVLKNKEGRPIGFIAIQWDKPHYDTVDQAVVSQLKGYVEAHLDKSK